jgi:homoserine O-acetyltransferase
MRDLVAVHRRLLTHLGISRLVAAVGGSLGGMQVLQWALDAPQDLHAAVVIASSSRLTAQNIAFSAVAREAIMRDPDFCDGRYYGTGRSPDVGLAVARMMAHITYVSEESLSEKFGRRIQDGDAPRFGFGADFQVESYLNHQGNAFLARFDANTYLYLTRVMDYFDAFDGPPPLLGAGVSDPRFLVMSFDSDWRFDTAHSLAMVRELTRLGVAVTFQEVRSPWGHDSFLLEIPEYHATVRAFLERAGDECGVAA